MPQKRKPNPPSDHKPLHTGFEEAQAPFHDTSLARERFNESVALLRAFNLIDEQGARQEVIDLARRHAGISDDE